jgi:hypothetical protein
MVAVWRCAIRIRPAARSCGLPVGSGRRSPLETDAASSTAKNIAHCAGLSAHFDQLGANTEPAGSQYSDTSDHEQNQGLEV